MNERRRDDPTSRDRRLASLGKFGEIFTPLVLLVIFITILVVLYLVAV